MGMPDTIRWTRDQVINLPADGNRYELVDGELLSWYGSRAVAGLDYLGRLASEGQRT